MKRDYDFKSAKMCLNFIRMQARSSDGFSLVSFGTNESEMS